MSAGNADPVPEVLFLCVHNAGRSQMAAGFARRLGGDSLRVRSAGSEPAERVNPVAVEAMAEVGIDISDAVRARLDDEAVRSGDYIITIGCGDACPVLPGASTSTGRSTTPRASPSPLCARSATRSNGGCGRC